MKDIFSVIKAEYTSMSRVEKSVADLILSDPQEFMSCSIAEVSRITAVSQGSINNFAKKFSDGGFAALKLTVAKCIPAYQNKPFSIITKSHSKKDAMTQKIAEYSAAFQNTFDVNSEAAIKNTVDRILSAKKIQLCGIFHSGIVAKDFCYQLVQMGIPATYVEDTLMSAVSAASLDEECVLIAVSSSGATKEIVDMAQIARKNRVPIIALTAHKTSPLTQISDEVLLSVSGELSISGRYTDIRISQMLIVDTLCAYIRSIIDEGGMEKYYKMREIISSHSIKD